jgi:uncharacterized protein YkwD
MTPLIIALLLLTNQARTTPLTYDTDLSARAQTRAEQLCTDRQWSHDGWKAAFEGYSGYVAENLAKFPVVKKQTDLQRATAIQTALMASPTHKANIVDQKFNSVGIGTACDVTVYLFWSGKK